MPRRMNDCGTRGAIVLPMQGAGDRADDQRDQQVPVEAVERDVGDRGGEHQRDGLHEVGADQPHRAQPGVEHEQRDHDHRAAADAGDADEQAAERADQQRRERPDRRVRVGVAARRRGPAAG